MGEATMDISVKAVIDAAQQLSPVEQLEIIEALSRSIKLGYTEMHRNGDIVSSSGVDIPAYVKRTPPITDLAYLAADWWPEDESADDINNFIAEQRRQDALSEIREY